MNATSLVALGYVLEWNWRERAFDGSFVAAWRERASIGKAQSVWNHTLDHLEPVFFLSAETKTRNGSKKPLCIWMFRVVKNVHHRTDFDDPACIHHSNGFGNFRDNSQIV